ncbi:hypothetical protein [Sinomonas susongensis]|uniref:hypothetical protein n=1 Tax=Sinomonas susongensis TaxID=1324851 RepID=UPI0011098192|nr:hypothetical protein [Sinomonas susongensis]
MTIIDTTETVGPLPIGYTDPAEPTGSDAESEPVHYFPVGERYWRNRIFKRDGVWLLGAAHNDTRFKSPLFGNPTHITSAANFPDAITRLRVESIKDLGFEVDTRVLVTSNRFTAFNGDRGVDFRDCTGRVVSIDPSLHLPIEVELDHHGYSSLFGADELEVTP